MLDDYENFQKHFFYTKVYTLNLDSKPIDVISMNLKFLKPFVALLLTQINPVTK